MAELATMATGTARKKSVYGGYYDYALRLAKRHGFLDVTSAVDAMLQNPALFTSKERRALGKGKQQMLRHFERERAKMVPNTTVSTTTTTTQTTTGTVTTIGAGVARTIRYGTGGTYEKPDPLKGVREQIKAHIAVYRTRRSLGRPVGVRTRIDRTIHTHVADGATWDMWTAARSLGADLNVFADAFALADGAVSVRIDDDLQAEAAAECAAVAVALDAIKDAILRMDALIAKAKPKKPALLLEGGNDADTASAAD